MFDTIRILRAASQPVTAAAIADEPEVTVRTVYVDVATLQARRRGAITNHPARPQQPLPVGVGTHLAPDPMLTAPAPMVSAPKPK